MGSSLHPNVSIGYQQCHSIIKKKKGKVSEPLPVPKKVLAIINSLKRKITWIKKKKKKAYDYSS